jgi:uncharacterized repeat protein (TIGR01451 family)
VLPACGSAGAALVTTIKQTSGDPKKVRPGDLVEFTLVVGNHGPGQATGVTVRADLPAGFRYQSTTSIDAHSTTSRTQPSDPPVDTAEPLWGQWTLGAPGVNADGTPARATLTLTFVAKAQGKPGDYGVVPHVFSEGGDEVIGTEAKVSLAPASDLTLTVAVDEPTVKRGDLVHYHVTVLNRGSGQANGVGLLVTLPGGITFNKIEHVDGNFTRVDPVDPIGGALVAYFGGWVLPPTTQARPGTVTLVFSARVLPTALGGRYTVAAQMTNADGAVIRLNDTAPVTVSAPTATPVPAPPAPTPTRKP